MPVIRMFDPATTSSGGHARNVGPEVSQVIDAHLLAEATTLDGLKALMPATRTWKTA
jgi:hypothetical protein